MHPNLDDMLWTGSSSMRVYRADLWRSRALAQVLPSRNWLGGVLACT